MEYILTKIGADWLTVVDDGVNSHIQQFFQIQGQITLDVLVQFDPKLKSSKNLLWPSLVLIGQYLQMLECKQSQIWQNLKFKGR